MKNCVANMNIDFGTFDILFVVVDIDFHYIGVVGFGNFDIDFAVLGSFDIDFDIFGIGLVVELDIDVVDVVVDFGIVDVVVDIDIVVVESFELSLAL